MFHVVLYLITFSVAELKDNDTVEMICSEVSSRIWCPYTVRWLLSSTEAGPITETTSGCSTTLYLLKSQFNDLTRDDPLKCKVMDSMVGKVQLFTFRPQSLKDDTGEI